MFKRLLKHQLKSTWKEFNIAYGVIVGLALLLILSIKAKNDALITISIILFACSALALSGLMIYFVIKLFYSTTYGKQGYLTFTLPISTHALIISKIISALLYMVGFAISILISAFLLDVFLDSSIIESYLPTIGELFDIINANPLTFIISSICSIISLLANLVILQFVFALANTITSSKKKVWIIILLLWAVSSATSIVSAFDPIGLQLCIDINTGHLIFLDMYDALVSGAVPFLSIWDLLISIGELVGLYFATVYLIDKKIEIQ